MTITPSTLSTRTNRCVIPSEAAEQRSRGTPAFRSHRHSYIQSSLLVLTLLLSPALEAVLHLKHK